MGRRGPLENQKRIALACFANDLLTFMDHLGLAAAIVGGISMGAAVALNFTLRFPQRVLGLVLSRPAWLDSPMLRNATIYARIAQLIRGYGPERGQELFQQSKEYKEVLSDSPDSANSLIGQFQNPRAAETVIKLERIPNDSPSRDRREWNSIQVPTLVLASPAGSYPSFRIWRDPRSRDSRCGVQGIDAEIGKPGPSRRRGSGVCWEFLTTSLCGCLAGRPVARVHRGSQRIRGATSHPAKTFRKVDTLYAEMFHIPLVG